MTTAAPVTGTSRCPTASPDDTAHFTYAGEIVTTSASPLISIGILDETSKEAGFARLETGPRPR